MQITGTITTRLPPLAPPLPVSDVFASIKCIETRLVGGTAENVLWEKRKRVWSTPDYVDFSDWSHPFRISIPTDVAIKTASSQTLKEWKTVWRFEIAVKHRPIQYVGDHIVKSFYLNILNHTAPPITPPSSLTDLTIGADAYAAVVTIEPPRGVYGPESSIPLVVRARPNEPDAVVKKVHVVLERVLEFLEDSSSSPPKSSLFRRTSPSKETSAEVQQIESVSTDDFEQEAGTSRCQVSIVLARRSRWDMGETVRTKLLSMRFQLRVKVTVKPAKSKASREFSCPPIPVTLCAITATELARARAVAPVVALKQPAQRKARSSRRGLYMHEGTVDIATDGVVSPPPVSRKRSISPFIPIATPGLKPILISPDQPTQPIPPQSIQFVFPSPPPHSSYLSPNGLPPISTVFSPTSAASPPSYDSWSIIKRFQATGRRISTTGSEEEALQPSRSRQRLGGEEPFDGRPSLPSLDALGLGLPQVARSPSRRPMTAPAFTAPFGSNTSFQHLQQMDDAMASKPPMVAFDRPLPPRPRTSFGATSKSPYPQDSESSRSGEVPSTPFAFTVKRSQED